MAQHQVRPALQQSPQGALYKNGVEYLENKSTISHASGSCGAARGQASAPAVPTGCPVQKDGFFHATFDLFKEKKFHLLRKDNEL